MPISEDTFFQMSSRTADALDKHKFPTRPFTAQSRPSTVRIQYVADRLLPISHFEPVLHRSPISEDPSQKSPPVHNEIVIKSTLSHSKLSTTTQERLYIYV